MIRWVRAGKRVIVAGLDGTSERTPFLSMLCLIPHADEAVKLRALCVLCGAEAPFTGSKVEKDAAICVGGKEIYEARCRKCWNKMSK